jgi:hypothetical protein
MTANQFLFLATIVSCAETIATSRLRRRIAIPPPTGVHKNALWFLLGSFVTCVGFVLAGVFPDDVRYGMVGLAVFLLLLTALSAFRTCQALKDSRAKVRTVRLA